MVLKRGESRLLITFHHVVGGNNRETDRKGCWRGTAADRNHLTCSVISEQETEGGTVFPEHFLPGPRTIGWEHHPLHRYETFHPDLSHSQLTLPQLQRCKSPLTSGLSNDKKRLF